MKHLDTSYIKQQVMEWRHCDSLSLKKFPVQKSAGKILAIVFCSVKGGPKWFSEERGGAISNDSLLSTRKNCVEMVRKVVQMCFAFKDNASAHKSPIAMHAIFDSGFEKLNSVFIHKIWLRCTTIISFANWKGFERSSISIQRAGDRSCGGLACRPR